MKLRVLRGDNALIFLIGAMLTSASVAQASDPDFCTTFKSVHSTAFRGFKPWRGAQDEDSREEFATTIKFPGVRTCKIGDDEFGYDFTCFWDYQYGADAQSTADAAALASAIRACLGHVPLPGTSIVQTPKQVSQSQFLWTDRIEGERDHVQVSVTVIKAPERKLRRTTLKASQTLMLVIDIKKY